MVCGVMVSCKLLRLYMCYHYAIAYVIVRYTAVCCVVVCYVPLCPFFGMTWYDARDSFLRWDMH